MEKRPQKNLPMNYEFSRNTTNKSRHYSFDTTSFIYTYTFESFHTNHIHVYLDQFAFYRLQFLACNTQWKTESEIRYFSCTVLLASLSNCHKKGIICIRMSITKSTCIAIWPNNCFWQVDSIQVLQSPNKAETKRERLQWKPFIIRWFINLFSKIFTPLSTVDGHHSNVSFTSYACYWFAVLCMVLVRVVEKIENKYWYLIWKFMIKHFFFVVFFFFVSY